MTYSKWIIVFLIFSLAGCATTKANWEKAQKIDTANGYEEFLKNHPKSEFEENARTSLVKKGWEEAQSKDTVDSYKIFLEKYGNSVFAVNARQRSSVLVLERDWKEAKRIDTIESYSNFLSKYPKAEMEYTSEALNRIHKLQNIALIKAASDGDDSKVLVLLTAGADVNAEEEEQGDTALFVAANNGHKSVIKVLLEKGADVNKKRNDGTTALIIASYKGHK